MLQVVGVALAVPFAVGFVYLFTSHGYETSFFHDAKRMAGFGMIIGISACSFAPWVALAALFRQMTGEARNRALAFELERSELEREALDARLRVLQAQVEPHFLFNTLANVRELVDSGSPQASRVLREPDRLPARGGAAPARAGSATLGQELELVRAYLEVMHMRMPDRLQFAMHADERRAPLPLPADDAADAGGERGAPRHRPERGGRPDRRAGARARASCCARRCIDTGVGLRAGHEAGTGTGLTNLRERLRLLFAGRRAAARIAPVAPHGASAEIVIPAAMRRR